MFDDVEGAGTMSIVGSGSQPGAPKPDPETRWSAVARMTDRRSVVAIAVIAFFLSALHVFWLRRFRFGYPVDDDESGYIAIGLGDTRAALRGGPTHLVHALFAQHYEAPLVPLTTVPAHLLFGRTVNASLLIMPGYAVVLMVLTYCLAHCLLNNRWAVVAAAVTGSLPVISDYSRDYSFAVPSSVMLTGALWAIVRSDRFRSIGWSAASGAFLAGMVTARTMTVAYTPGVVLAAGAMVLFARDERKRRAINLATAGLVAVGLAGSWFLPNIRYVGHFLVGVGYGSRSLGKHYPIMSVDYWLKELRVVVDYVSLPMAAILLFSGLLGLYCWIRVSDPSHPSKQRIQTYLSSPVFLLTLVIANGYFALTSTSTPGTGFEVTWIPALVIICVFGLSRIREDVARRSVLGLLALVSVLNVGSKSGLSPELARPRQLAVPVLGERLVTDGEGLIQHYLATAGYHLGGPTSHMPALQQRWRPEFRRITSWMISYAAKRGRQVFVGVRYDPLLTNNTIPLSAEETFRRQAVAATLANVTGRDTDVSYGAQLRSSGTDFLVAAEPAIRDSGSVPIDLLSRSARLAGYSQVKVFDLPDKRRAIIWWQDRPASSGTFYN